MKIGEFRRDAERCPATWNPGVWPYTTRCIADAGHGPNHLDRHGNTFADEQLPTHDAGDYRDPDTGVVDVEAHRLSFEGSTLRLADHLIFEHGLKLSTVARWRDGLTQGDWIALDDLHRNAHQD